MKNIRYKFIRVTMTLLLIVLMSCSEEFIDLQPTDTVSVGALYKTDNDFNDAVNGAYTGLMEVYKTWWWYGDGTPATRRSS